MIFRLITEGPTDQVVLRSLLARYFANPDIDVRPVQPNTDSTDKMDHFGGWENVLNYCASTDMAPTLEADGFVVIQIDTDVCEDYGIQKREGGNDKKEEQIIEQTRELIISKFSPGLYANYQSKVIFAISHESIECWLLPLYFNDNKRKKQINCCETLNLELIRQEQFTLDCNSKKVLYYNKMCKSIKNKVQIDGMAIFNPSFKQFTDQLALI